MAVVENQTIPYTDILYTNSDVRYLGEFYRDALTEEIPAAGLNSQKGIVRKTSKGRRPSQQGMAENPNLTADQVNIRAAMRATVASWHRQKEKESDRGPCDSVYSKEYWYQAKKNAGVVCSYYDYFFRTTLKYYFDNLRWPPWFDNYYIFPTSATMKPGQFKQFYFPYGYGDISWEAEKGWFYGSGLYEAPGEPGVYLLKATDEEGRVGCATVTVEGPPPGYTTKWWHTFYLGMPHDYFPILNEGDPYSWSMRLPAPEVYTGWVKTQGVDDPNFSIPEYFFYLDNSDCIGRFAWTGKRQKTCSISNQSDCSGNIIDLCMAYFDPGSGFIPVQVWKLEW